MCFVVQAGEACARGRYTHLASRPGSLRVCSRMKSADFCVCVRAWQDGGNKFHTVFLCSMLLHPCVDVQHTSPETPYSAFCLRRIISCLACAVQPVAASDPRHQWDLGLKRLRNISASDGSEAGVGLALLARSAPSSDARANVTATDGTTIPGRRGSDPDAWRWVESAQIIQHPCAKVQSLADSGGRESLREGGFEQTHPPDS